MSFFDPVVAHRLDTTSVQRRWLTFLRHSAALATVVTGLILLWGVSLVRGWVTSTLIASVTLGLVLMVGLLAWGIVGLVVAARPDGFQSLAEILERAHRPLLDRLNTLVFLRERNDPALRPYAECIEVQARQVLDRAPPPFPFSWRRALIHLAVLALTIVFTGWFFVSYHPWRAMIAHQAAAVAEAESRKVEPIASLTELPPEKDPAPEEPWGEVRVSEPGGDIRATTLDVVPMMIEAAASRPLTRVQWYSAVNGGAETLHGLPAPEDPSYAVFRPELVLEDLHVEPWDVVSYYAAATCEDRVTYRSELYFINVLPFQAELDDLPGGREGPSFEVLQRLSGMIERQQEVLRQSDAESRRDRADSAESKQRREQLAVEEGTLAQESRHLSAAAESEFDPTALGDLGEHFERSAKSLDAAEQSLPDASKNADAWKQQNDALAELVATRKQFQQLVSQNPEAFRGRTRHSQLAESNRLQDELQQQIAELSEIERQPDAPSAEQLAKTSRDAKELLKQLDRHATQDSSQLRRDLSAQKLKQLNAQCDQLPSQGSQGRRTAAGELKQGFEQFAQALSQDQTQQRQADLARQAAELDQMQKRAEQFQSVRKQLQNALLEQRNIERSVSPNSTPNNQKNQEQLAERQRKLSESLDRLIEKNGECFGNCQKECAGAQSASHNAGQAIRQGAGNARELATAAGDQLQQLDNAVEEQLMRQRLADSHQLKQMLDEQIETLDQPPQQPPGGGQSGQQPGKPSGGQSPGSPPSGLSKSPGATPGGNPLGQSPSGTSGLGGMPDASKLSELVQRTTDQLKQIADQDPTKDRFGPSLRESLSESRKQEIDNAARQLSSARNGQQQSAAAEHLQPQLEDVSLAFEESQSASTRSGSTGSGSTGVSPFRSARVSRPRRTSDPQMAESGDPQPHRSGDPPAAGSGDPRRARDPRQAQGREESQQPLSESGQPAIAQGLRQLESAARRRELGRSSPATDAQLRTSAARNLQNGVWGEYGHNDRTDALVQQMTDDLREPDFQVDALTVQELLRQIQSLRREVATKSENATEESDLQRQDTNRFPPAYRRSIEKYFEKLSEQP